MVDLTAFLQTPDATVRNVLEKLDLNRAGIVLIVDSNGKLLQTITDGDVRRAMLAGVVPTDSVQTLLDHKRQTPSPAQPISALNTTSIMEQRQLMQQHSIRQLPLLDEAGRVTNIALLNELLSQEASNLPLTAVIMAGGLGTRLRPLTLDTPKPMLLVGERPIMEWVILGLRRSGIREFIITTHYLPEQITDYFGDGSKWGITIDYIREEALTGTAGPLLKMNPWDRTLLVTNSDLLTNLDYGAMYQFHQEQEALITVAMREYFVQVPYGTIDLDGSRLTGMTEKPLPTLLHQCWYLFLRAGSLR